jgi:uncharacterized BrkB/YihY/UPF0761 family membrane protein
VAGIPHLSVGVQERVEAALPDQSHARSPFVFCDSKRRDRRGRPVASSDYAAPIPHRTSSARRFLRSRALFFGLNFGRVLQLVHARAWQIQLPRRQTDQALYTAVLLGLYGLILLLLVQLTELRGSPDWVGNALALGWVGLLVVYFVWAPWQLTHRRLRPRDLLPGAVLTAFGLVALMLISSYVMDFWVNLYARDYGGFGVVLAIYFWILFSSGIIVWAASLSPTLAERRKLRRRS